MIHKVIIALGTNVDSDRIKIAKDALHEVLTDVRFSQTLATEALGSKFHGTQFHNALASGSTTLDAPSIIALLKSIESQSGDTRELRQQGKVVLDLDLLKHDATRFHPSDWERDYVKELMREVVG